MHCVDSRHQCRPRQSGGHGRFARFVHRSRPRKCTHDIEQRKCIVPVSAPQRAQVVLPSKRRLPPLAASQLQSWWHRCDLAAVIDENPLLNIAKEPARHLVAFVADKRLVRCAPCLLVAGSRCTGDHRRAAYPWCSTRILESASPGIRPPGREHLVTTRTATVLVAAAAGACLTRWTALASAVSRPRIRAQLS